ncbi:hypothetical protein D3C78_1749740 [compost metagenome]
MISASPCCDFTIMDLHLEVPCDDEEHVGVLCVLRDEYRILGDRLQRSYFRKAAC